MKYAPFTFNQLPFASISRYTDLGLTLHRRTTVEISGARETNLYYGGMTVIEFVEGLRSIQLTGLFAQQCRSVQDELSILIPLLEMLHLDFALAQLPKNAVDALHFLLLSAKKAICEMNGIDHTTFDEIRHTKQWATMLVGSVHEHIIAFISECVIANTNRFDKMHNVSIIKEDNNIEVVRAIELICKKSNDHDVAVVPERADLIGQKVVTTNVEYIDTAIGNASNFDCAADKTRTTNFGLTMVPTVMDAIELSSAIEQQNLVLSNEEARQYGNDYDCLHGLYAASALDPIHVPTREEREVQQQQEMDQYLRVAQTDCVDTRELAALLALEMFGAEAISHFIKVIVDGKEELQHKGAALLRTITARDSYNRLSVVQAGAIPILVQALTTEDVLTQEHCAAATANLAIETQYQRVLADAGVIPILVQLLLHGTEHTREAAAGALRNLAVCVENRKAIVVAGGIPPLVEILKRGSDSAKEEAAAALCNVGCDEEGEMNIAAAGAIPLLVQLLGEGTDSAKLEAAAALWCLSALNRANIPRVTAAGAIPLFLDLLAGDTMEVWEVAVGALAILSEYGEVRDEMIASGAIPLLVKLLQQGTKMAKAQSLQTLSILSAEDESKEAIATAGAIPSLVQILTTGTKTAQEHTIAILINLSERLENGAVLVDRGVIRVMLRKVLRGEQSVKRQYLCAMRHLARRNFIVKHEIKSSDTRNLIRRISWFGNEHLRIEAKWLCNALYAETDSAEGRTPASTSNSTLFSMLKWW